MDRSWGNVSNSKHYTLHPLAVKTTLEESSRSSGLCLHRERECHFSVSLSLSLSAFFSIEFYFFDALTLLTKSSRDISSSYIISFHWHLCPLTPLSRGIFASWHFGNSTTSRYTSKATLAQQFGSATARLQNAMGPVQTQKASPAPRTGSQRHSRKCRIFDDFRAVFDKEFEEEIVETHRQTEPTSRGGKVGRIKSSSRFSETFWV